MQTLQKLAITTKHGKTSRSIFYGDLLRALRNHHKRSLAILPITSRTASITTQQRRSFRKEIKPRERTSIAIIGSGAVGSYYGARLWETGLFDVKFLMRGMHLKECRKSGLQVSSNVGDIFIPPNPNTMCSSLEEIGKVDWIIIALKNTYLKAIPTLMQPLLKSSTRVLTTMNGFIDDDVTQMLQTSHNDSSDELACHAIYSGMAFICSERVEPGFIQHTSANEVHCSIAATKHQRKLVSLRETSVINDHKKALERLWLPTKVRFVFEPCLLRARWLKSCTNLPFSGLSVVMGGITVDVIMKDPGLRFLAEQILDETISLANADLLNRGEDPSFLLGDVEKRKIWHVFDNMGPFKPSTTLDLLARRAIEVEYIFRKPLDRANELNIHVPYIENIVNQIEAIQRMHGLF